jgi:hypothetical protein
MMKYICYPFALLIFLSCQPKELPTQVKAESEECYLKASHMTTRDELIQIKQNLKKVGIDLEFGESTFFDNEKLRTLNLVVLFPDGTGGSCTADLTKLQYKYYGFQYSTTKQPRLKTGALD